MKLKDIVTKSHIFVVDFKEESFEEIKQGANVGKVYLLEIGIR